MHDAHHDVVATAVIAMAIEEHDNVTDVDFEWTADFSFVQNLPPIGTSHVC